MALTEESRRELAAKMLRGFFKLEDKESLTAYLAGLSDIDQITEAEPFGDFYYQWLEGNLPFEASYQTEPEVKEMVLRLIGLFMERQPDLLLKYFNDRPSRFLYYRDAGVPEEWVFKDLIRSLQMSGRSQFFDGLSSLEAMAFGMREFLPEMAEKLMRLHEASTDRDFWVSDLGLVIGVLAAADKRASLVEEKLLPAIAARALSDGADETQVMFLYQYLSFCEGISAKVDQLAQGYLLRCPRWVYERQGTDRLLWFPELCEKLHSGPLPKWYYYLHHIASAWDQNRDTVYGKMVELAAKFPQSLTEAFCSLHEARDSRVLAALFMMQRMGMDPETFGGYRDKAEAFLISQAGMEHQNCLLKTGQGLFEFLSGEDYSSLKEEDPAQVTFSLKKAAADRISWWSDDSSWFYLAVQCGLLMDVLPAARNLVWLAAAQMEGYGLVRLKLYDNARLLYADRNPWEALYLLKFPVGMLIRLYILCMGQSYCYPDSAGIKGEMLQFLDGHREEAEAEARLPHMDGSDYLIYLHLLYRDGEGYDPACLVDALASKSHYVAEFAEEYLRGEEKRTRAAVEETVGSSSRRAAANAAQRLLRFWDSEKMEKEMGALTDGESLHRYIEKLYTKNNEKNVPYQETVDYGGVRLADSEERMPALVMKYYISEYILLKELYLVKPCEEIRRRLNLYDLQNLMRSLYECWLADGAKTKYKNLLFPYALCAGTAQLEVLRKQIDDWSQNSKPGLAVFALSCMAFNGSQMAFMMVDAMSRKHKNKRVKKAALEALTEAMKAYGLSREEFEDLIVPDLGFGPDRVRLFSYGSRSFRAVLGQDMSLTLYDGEKQLKSLPKASEKYGDIPEAAEAAKEEWKAVKKQLKTVVDDQRQRIAAAVFARRTWSADKWRALFIDNPLMFPFANGMIWLEENEKGEGLGTFRYMEDGSFNTADEEEYALGEGGRITLAHPAEMSPEEIEAWNQQLEDYEVVQPAAQMALPTVKLEESRLHQTDFPYRQGVQFYAATVKGTAGKLGCDLTFQDYGQCNGFGREFGYAGLRMSLKVSEFYPGDYDTMVEIQELCFLREDGGKAELCQVPGRLLSFALQAVSMLTAKAVEKAEE